MDANPAIPQLRYEGYQPQQLQIEKELVKNVPNQGDAINQSTFKTFDLALMDEEEEKKSLAQPNV